MQQKNKKHIAIIGSTGNIGTQALDVIQNNEDLFTVEVLTANNNADLLIQQAKKFNPNAVVIVNEDKYLQVKEALQPLDIKVFSGSKSLEDIMTFSQIDIVLIAVVGIAGLRPTMAAVNNNKTIALSNKETMVVSGEIITRKAIENNVAILPVDSEHSAIFQCLQGEINNKIRRIYITASGGVFRGKSKDELKNITPKDALHNPNWVMGQKVTIDSATLMNKGLETIEAHWLFNVPVKDIIAVVHPQSVIHSMVEFEDGSIKAQMAKADMRIPINYALCYPKRVKTSGLNLNLFSCGPLTFEKPDFDTFPCLTLAYNAIEQGGIMPCVLNAANEVAVNKFLTNKISFLSIADMVSKAMETTKNIQNPTLEDYLQTDKIIREKLEKDY